MIRQAQRDLVPSEAVLLPHWGISRAVRFIHEHYSENLGLEDTAERAFLSKYHFSRLFHRVVGLTFQDYVTLTRLQKAKELLSETPYRSVTGVASKVGFRSLRSFEIHFKQIFGQTPSEYRSWERIKRQHPSQDVH